MPLICTRGIVVFLGYHIFRRIWEATLGETLSSETEPSNHADRYAVSVLKGDIVMDTCQEKYPTLFTVSEKRRVNQLQSEAILCRFTSRRARNPL